jgi:hypothetical protein
MLVAQVEIQPATDSSPQQQGDVRKFYNLKFLPSIEGET